MKCRRAAALLLAGAVLLAPPLDAQDGARAFFPLIADPKPPHFFATWLWITSPIVTGQVASVGLGADIVLAPAHAHKWETSVAAGVFSQFNMQTRSNDLINTDFVIGFPFAYRTGPLSVRARIYHQSSHLGDEFILNTNPTRVNLSFEAAELLVARDFGGLRLYGGGEYILRHEPSDLRPGLLHGGIEYRHARRVVHLGGLGGPARYFCECAMEADVLEALALARSRGLEVQIIGGGSNVVFADAGFRGLVVRVTIGGVSFHETSGGVELTAGAGVEWDALVRRTVEGGWAGVECLSGIPGTVGATPIQNVGAYGQEIADTLVSVTCLERQRMTPVTFTRDQCEFGYRQSRFKARDRDRYVVLGVTLRLRRELPRLRYAELEQAVRGSVDLKTLDLGDAVRVVRDTVLELRRRKSMVLDPTDPNRRSVGSFFVNPVLSTEAFEDLASRWRASGMPDSIPTFPARCRNCGREHPCLTLQRRGA